MAIYLYPVDDTFTIFYEKSAIPNGMKAKVIEVNELPEGDGILRRSEDGTFHREQLKLEPIEQVQPQPTMEEIQLQTLLNTEFLVIMSEIGGL